MRIWIFGAGFNGVKAYHALGSNNIVGVIDNNKVGLPFLNGTEIISIANARGLLGENDIILISPDPDAAIQISNQLRGMGIHRFVFWITMQDNVDKYLEMMNGYSNDEQLIMQAKEDEMHILHTLVEVKNRQLNYVINHVDPRDIRTIENEFRVYQHALVSFAMGFLYPIYKEHIYPILAAGNLLGYVRHNGFIPWDDDLDFKLLRQDYERFISYCRNTYKTIRYIGKSVWFDGGKEYLDWISAQFDSCDDEYIVVEHPSHIWVLRRDKKYKYLSMDVFSIDAYDEGTDWKEHRKMLDELGSKIKSCVTCEEMTGVVEEYKEIDRRHWSTEGNKLFYGVDNEESYEYYMRNDDFLKRSDIFPLKKVNWEGGDFYVPNKPDECCRYVFGDNYMKLTIGFGLAVHQLQYHDI